MNDTRIKGTIKNKSLIADEEEVVGVEKQHAKQLLFPSLPISQFVQGEFHYLSKICTLLCFAIKTFISLSLKSLSLVLIKEGFVVFH